jgi:hypothetical protein
MGLEEIVSVGIIESGGVESLASFDVPAILASTADTPGSTFGAGRTKLYPMTTAGLASVLTDWGAGATYSAAQVAFSQPERPDRIAIIKRDAEVAQVKDIIFDAPLNTGDVVSGIVNFQAVSVTYATSMASTLTALAAAIQALDGIATAVSDGTDTITVTGDAGWNVDISLTAEGGDEPGIEIDITTAGRTAANDVAAAIAETATNLWYSISPVQFGVGLILALAQYVETTEKMLLIQSTDSGIWDSTDTSNPASWLQALGYRRTMGIARHVSTDYANVAAAVEHLSNAPGSSQFANREYVGVVGSLEGQISTGQAAVAEGRNFNTYRRFTSNTSLLRQGVRVDGEPAELTRDLDYCRNVVREEVFAFLKNNKKPGFDADGLLALRSVLNKCADRFVAEQIARNDQPVTVVVPPMSAQTQANQRRVIGCQINFTYRKGQISASIDLGVQL